MTGTRANQLPKGQYNLGSMPRFGLPPYASRLPSDLESGAIKVSGNVTHPGEIDPAGSGVAAKTQTSDFHCVTTWSCIGVEWRGWSFADVWEQLIVPQIVPTAKARFVIFIGREGYAACLPLEDLLTPDVMITSEINGRVLGAANGGALRLVAPAHYGYKSVKHLRTIKIVENADAFKGAALRFLVHPRGRVAFEERGSGLPAWVLRYAYKPAIRPNIRLFERALR